MYYVEGKLNAVHLKVLITEEWYFIVYIISISIQAKKLFLCELSLLTHSVFKNSTDVPIRQKMRKALNYIICSVYLSITSTKQSS